LKVFSQVSIPILKPATLVSLVSSHTLLMEIEKKTTFFGN
jgi:hypothetical protein